MESSSAATLYTEEEKENRKEKGKPEYTLGEPQMASRLISQVISHSGLLKPGLQVLGPSLLLKSHVTLVSPSPNLYLGFFFY